MKFLGEERVDDYCLLNVMYHKKEDVIDIILRHRDSNTKRIYTITKPKIEVYITKEQFRDYSTHKTHFNINKCDKYFIEYKSLSHEIPKLLGDEFYEAYLEEKKNKGFYESRNFYKLSPYVYGIDFDIESLYRCYWNISYNNNIPANLTKSYIDIEVDGIECEGVPLGGLYPITMVSYVDQLTKSSVCFILNNEEIDELVDIRENPEKFREECKQLFDPFYDINSYDFLFFDSEVELLKDLFTLINKNKRDYVLIWNISYDIPYIIDRIKYLGFEPTDIMCDRDFQVKEAWFYEDKINKTIDTKAHSYKISSCSVYEDSMRLYAGIRSVGSEIPSFRLDDVATSELGSGKIDFKEEGNIKTIYRNSFRKFLLYSIKDTLLMYGIEKKTEDVDALTSKMISNCAAPRSCFKQTQFLHNRIYYELYSRGYIIGTNTNSLDMEIFDKFSDDDIKYGGGFVADPTLNNLNGLYVLGQQSRFIFKYVSDYDFAAMYPNILMSHNQAPHTMYGKCIIENRINNNHYNKFDLDNDLYDAGREFVDNIACKDIGALGKKWFNLPSLEELIKEII